MKRIFAMLFVGILWWGCPSENEDEKFVPAGRYKLPSTATFGKVRMYTSQGAVTDEAKIRKFLSGVPKPDLQEGAVDYAELFSFDTFSRPVGDGEQLDVTFYSDKAVVQTNLLSGFGVAPDEPYEASVFNSGNLFIVSKGKSAMDVPITSITEFFEKDGVKKISTESHYLRTPVTYMPGRINFALLEQNGQLILPFLHYVHGRHLQHDIRSYSAESTCNLLNADFIKHIPVGDTIVVRESWVVLQKQKH